MKESASWADTGSVKLYLRRWLPDDVPIAYITIIHGMGEHSACYTEFAEFLCKNKIAVYCPDLRGHGMTADLNINSEAEGGILGHSADKKGFTKVLSDIEFILNTAQKEYPELPNFLFGHSWGSFLVQAYIETYKRVFAGVILSGTRGPGGLEISAFFLFIIFWETLRGKRHKSMFIYAIVFGSYNKYFAPCKTNADWLSRDENEIAKRTADPLCGKLASVAFFRSLFFMLKQIHKIHSIEKINQNIPIYFFSGTKDPVSSMGKTVAALARKYTSIGIKDVELVLYPGGRHECLHETNRKEVMKNILIWLEKHL